MKYRIICAIDIDAKTEEEAQAEVVEIVRGKAEIYVDYIEEAW
jgi:hypothetical protein